MELGVLSIPGPASVNMNVVQMDTQLFHTQEKSKL